MRGKLQYHTNLEAMFLGTVTQRVGSSKCRRFYFYHFKIVELDAELRENKNSYNYSYVNILSGSYMK